MKLRTFAERIGVRYETAWRWFKSGKIKGRQLDTGTIIVTEDFDEPAQVDYMVAWTGEHSGQTLDPSHSYVTVQCDDSKTLFVSGHLFKTNLPNQQLQVYYKLDGSAPHLTPGTYTTSADGTGDFAFSVEGMTSGNHVVIIEVNHLPDNLTYYIDTNAANGGAGVPFTCP